MTARGGTVLAIVALAAMAPVVAPAAGDRLDRFRAEAVRALGATEVAGEGDDSARVAPLYALIDEEILDSLESGGPFASPAFIQGQLDGFAATWGGAVLRVRAVGAGRTGAPLLVGSFALGTAGRTGSVRVYASGPGGSALLTVSSRSGAPEVLDWPPTRRGEAQFVVRWYGEASGRGTRSLQLDLWRHAGAQDVRVVWSTADRFPEGLWAAGVEVTPGEIVLRYEPRYPGWKPGCDGQTEQVDVYRYEPAMESLILARRHAVNAWHRELQAAVARFFAARHEGDERTLVELVPDTAVWARLPGRLNPEPACEGRAPDRPGAVAVAASEPRGEGLVPWSLWWARGAGGWQLTAAAPVLH